jgi:hypothetical protein
MDAVVVKAGEGHALRLGDVHMVVKEDGMHTRGALGLAEFEVPLRVATFLLHISIMRTKRVFTSSKANWSLR